MKTFVKQQGILFPPAEITLLLALYMAGLATNLPGPDLEEPVLAYAKRSAIRSMINFGS